jgi:molybdopterin molybdotransferase
LATFGYSSVTVYRQPVVGILSTGSELQPVDEPLQPGKIRDSNSAMIAHLVRQAGGIPMILGHVEDDEDKLVSHLEAHLPRIDILTTTGGVSVGDYDMMRGVYARLGADAVFWKSLIRPGMPVLVARKGDKPFFGLSGNPASAFVNAWSFLLPAIRYMQGAAAPFVKKVTAYTVERIVKQPIKHTRLMRGTAFVESGQLKVSLAAAQSSGVLSSYLGANCVVRVPGGTQYEAGELVEIELFGELGSLNLL